MFEGIAWENMSTAEVPPFAAQLRGSGPGDRDDA